MRGLIGYFLGHGLLWMSVVIVYSFLGTGFASIAPCF